jgi:hypothetical protein
MAIDSLTETDSLVISWRRDELVGCGFPLPLAAAVAGDPAYDLHALVDLTRRGCAPALAVRILAPVEEASAA